MGGSGTDTKEITTVWPGWGGDGQRNLEVAFQSQGRGQWAEKEAKPCD